MDSQQQRFPQPPYNYNDNHFGPPYSQSTAMGKQQFETIETTMPPLNHAKSSSSFSNVRTHHDEMPTEAEMSLLRKLRTLNGADYEAQYFDNKPEPNKNSQFSKMGNPTAL